MLQTQKKYCLITNKSSSQHLVERDKCNSSISFCLCPELALPPPSTSAVGSDEIGSKENKTSEQSCRLVPGRYLQYNTMFLWLYSYGAVLYIVGATFSASFHKSPYLKNERKKWTFPFDVTYPVASSYSAHRFCRAWHGSLGQYRTDRYNVGPLVSHRRM